MRIFYKILRPIWHFFPESFRYGFSKFFWEIYKIIYLSIYPKPNNIIFNRNAKYYIFGFFSSNLSHKSASDLLILELESKGLEYCKVDISDIHFRKKSKINFDEIDFPRYGDNIVFLINPDILPFILKKIPRTFLENKYLIGYWVYELNILPFIWKAALSKVNEIWVPSSFVKDTFSIYTKNKFKVIPHAVGLQKYEKLNFSKEKVREEYEISGEHFVALTSFSFSSSMERKNIIGTIDAFEKAFSKEDKALLIIRYINESNFINSHNKLLEKVSMSSANIKLIRGGEFDAGVSELYKLYIASDVLLSLHRSEGFGLQIFEAMKHGLPVICTNYSGPVDFINDRIAMLVPYQIVQVVDDDKIYNLKNAKWALPDINVAAKYLLQLKQDNKLLNGYKTNIQNEIKKMLVGINEL